MKKYILAIFQIVFSLHAAEDIKISDLNSEDFGLWFYFICSIGIGIGI